MLRTGPHVPVRYVAEESRTVGDMFRRRARASADKPAMHQKLGGAWREITWQKFHDEARHVAGGLLALGLKRGDRVAILGATQPPWAVYDMAAQLAGLVALGIYPKQSVEQIRYIVDHSDATVVFVDELVEAESVLAAVAGNDKVRAIVPWTAELYAELTGRDDRLTSPAGLRGAEPLSDDQAAAIVEETDPHDTAILVYTSGTTGPPKGAMISHHNITSLLSHQGQFLDLFEDDLSYNFLPMAHVAERVLGFYGRINSGIATAYASSIGAVLDELQEVRPTLFGSVPRIFEKAYGKIHSEIQKRPPVVRALFKLATEVGKEALPYRLAQRDMPPLLKAKYRLADVVFRKIRGAFGGRVRQFATGAAPIALDILEFFWGAGLNVYEMYGMTEATVVTHANRQGHVKLGTVGKVITPLEHRIADDGEVLIRGPYVFKGYFKNEEATASTIVDGWLHTGDVGTIDAEGYLRITDRKKHLIITAGGKNLAPANIENAIKNQDPLVSQVHAHGDRRPYVSALVAPSPIETLEWGHERGIISRAQLEERTRELLANPSSRSDALNEAMASVTVHAAFRERIAAAVRAGNRDLSQVERVRRFTILDRDFSQEQGELTPTMKVKRKAVETKYAELFDRIYDEDGFAIQA